jgi:soluble lytic murein transglycosylase
VDYWELHSRLTSARLDEVEGFYTRWRGRYVEDRLRNDWLLELGRRREWGALTNDFARFRMNDDREVSCYAILARHAVKGGDRAASTSTTSTTTPPSSNSTLAPAPTPSPSGSGATSTAGAAAASDTGTTASAAPTSATAEKSSSESSAPSSDTTASSAAATTASASNASVSSAPSAPNAATNTAPTAPTPVRPSASLKTEALAAWLEQRDADDGCHALADAMFDAKLFGADEGWTKVRLMIDLGRMRAARQAAGLIAPAHADTIAEIQKDAARYLNKHAHTKSRDAMELTAIALARLAGTDPDLATASLRGSAFGTLSPTLQAWTWAQIGEQAAQKLLPHALEHYKAAYALIDTNPKAAISLSDESLSWAVRAALRASDPARWSLVARSIAAMRPATAADSTWQYWLARAQLESAKPGAEGEPLRERARTTLRELATEPSFYGLLAAEDQGRGFTLPPKPEALSPAERAQAKRHTGLHSALAMMGIGLRDEGVREWNYSLRGMGERELLAAAQLACEREVWDRCINTSERTRSVIDIAQRYPTPFKRDLLAKAKEAGLDGAYVYGLIRQESRFITEARSHVGASGLMQLMPRTARWTAQRMGIANFKPQMVNEPAVNLALGTHYLKLVLDDLGGSQAMAAAAYNAGPGRPRRWREGATVEAAVWAENIPFNETRDYVKKVLSNAVVYSAVLGEPNAPTLKSRLGATIGPREAALPATRNDLP